MNPNLLEQFLGPSAQFFCFNSNDCLVTPTEKKTSLLTKRNIYAGSSSNSTNTTITTTTITTDTTHKQQQQQQKEKQSNSSNKLNIRSSDSTDSNSCVSLLPPASLLLLANNKATTSSTTSLTSTNSKMVSSKSQMSGLSSHALNTRPATSGSSSSANATGAVDAQLFQESFENVPRVQIFDKRDLVSLITQIHGCLSDENNDWEKRVDSLKRLRSVALFCKQNPQFIEDFFVSIKNLAVCMAAQIKDLRSLTVREACITVSYLSQILQNRFELFAELILQDLINLIQASAKVMSTSGSVACQFLIENVHAPRLLPIIINSMNSRSKEIRRACCEYLNQLLQAWETECLTKHQATIAQAIKKGIADADQDARLFSRKAYWSFHAHFASQAQKLLDSLELKYQKLIQSGAQDRFGSMKSVNNEQHDTFKSIASNNLNDIENSSNGSGGGGQQSSSLLRSTSAVDFKNSSTRSSSVKRPTPALSRIPQTKFTSSTTVATPNARIVQSQPGSRSTSPTSKISYITHSQLNTVKSSGYGQKTLNNSFHTTPNTSMHSNAYSTPSKSKIPMSSRNSSRESSPGRRSSYGRVGGSAKSTVSTGSGSGGRRLFHKQLSNNPDSEQAVAVAIHTKYRDRRWNGLESDEASETSSICSERSFSSSLGAVRVTEVRDFSDILSHLTSSQWSERRDGILILRRMISTGRTFNRQEIKRLTEVYTRLFHDPHGKVFGLFLENLTDFIQIYKRDLQDWLSVLLTRLLSKLGSEILPSVYQKLCRCLEAVRSSFDLDLQFKILINFINDASQSPNLKVKIAVLKYLQDIICLMEPADFHADGDVKIAVSKITAFTAEPKSVELRKTAQTVIVTLFNLNAPELTMLLSDLPKKCQENASRILQNHIQMTQDKQIMSQTSGNSYLHDYVNGNQLINDIQSLGTKVDMHKVDSISKDSGIQLNVDVDSAKSNESLDSRHLPQSCYDPHTYSDTGSNVNLFNLKSVSTIMENLEDLKIKDEHELVSTFDDLTRIIKSGAKQSNTSSGQNWSNETFNKILISLFEGVSSHDASIQISALCALKELLQFHNREFSNYIELTIMKLIEQYKDTANDVSKHVEEVIYTAARCLPVEACVRVLRPLIETADFPKNLIAIRMLQKAFEERENELCMKLLPDALGALMTAWDSSHSAVRKAAVFCLVDVYLIVGDELRQHLTHLSSSKLKLLNVYINRAREQLGK